MTTVIESTAQPGVFGLSPAVKVFSVYGGASGEAAVTWRLLNGGPGSPVYGTTDNNAPGGAQRTLYDQAAYQTALQAVKDFTDPWSGFPAIVNGTDFVVTGWDNIAAVFGITLT